MKKNPSISTRSTFPSFPSLRTQAADLFICKANFEIRIKDFVSISIFLILMFKIEKGRPMAFWQILSGNPSQVSSQNKKQKGLIKYY
jgi:hypothetical protein